MILKEDDIEINFSEYSQHIPTQIPISVQNATTKFLGNRAIRVAELGDWEELREQASRIRKHTLKNMSQYLTQLEENILELGGYVHWAKDAEEARNIILEIASKNQVKNVVKAKSMATEEIGLNLAFLQKDINVTETDLGEFIIQLAESSPSHIIVPAIHLTKEEIAQLFREKLGVDVSPDPIALAETARAILRKRFFEADMGISGANFLVAETGTLVMVTNEGNGRMCTTMPPIHVAVAGIDKVIPDMQSLAVFLKLLARSATGQKLSTYTAFINGPSTQDGEFGPKEFHLVLLDNGRTRILSDPIGRDVLKCIRCGCCLNICPVYQHVGGYAYGWFISGPIGAIFTPQILGTQKARELPYASTLCGACADVCPVKIPIPEILLYLRKKIADGSDFEKPVLSPILRLPARLGRIVLGSHILYVLASKILSFLMYPLRKTGWISRLPAPLNRWTKVRPFPIFRASSTNRKQ